MWYFADFNILIRKIILNKFQFQPQSVLNLFLFGGGGGDFSLSVPIKFVVIKKKCNSKLLPIRLSNKQVLFGP